MYGMIKSKLNLVPHDQTWASDFANEKQRILLASNLQLVVEHVGSTAIPTVHAKPILDIAILCDEANLTEFSQVLGDLDYEFRGNYGDSEDHYYAVLDRNDTRLCQIHIYTHKTSDWLCKLTFRDVLSTNEKLALEYNNYKLKLAKIASSKGEYAEIKSNWLDGFISRVMAQA